MIKWSKETVQKFARKITHAQGDPKKIGLAVGVGVFIAWFPIPGTHTAMALGGAWLLRINPAIVLVGSWINNPFTLVPIWLSGFWLGLVVTNTHDVHVRWDMDMNAIMEMSKTFFVPFCVGNIILGTVAGVISFFLAVHAVKEYRRRNPLALPEEENPDSIEVQK